MVDGRERRLFRSNYGVSSGASTWNDFKYDLLLFAFRVPAEGDTR